MVVVDESVSQMQRFAVEQQLKVKFSEVSHPTLILSHFLLYFGVVAGFKS
jgi:hypothetical protein